MARIFELDSHVADLIAAGEVVERPASVVKELMENAIDAGASQIAVEIQRGGMALIRVTDNGSGILPEDAETAFLRHATSKLKTAGDLEAIGTLGFRGEALAAICAVSRVELFTRTAEHDLGVNLMLEGGLLRQREETGCPEGTTMIVRDLFFNTPARLKFMKRDAAEGAAVFALVQRASLAHPEVSVKFIRDGKQELLTPGDGKLRSALYAVFGRDIAAGFTEVNGSGEEVTVTGFVSIPACCRGTRGYQHFILNGRPIQSRMLAAALEEAYRNQKMVGKFPGCVLHIEMKHSAVDVNVHPAKTEVKFFSDKRVFDAVYYSILSAFGGGLSHPEMKMDRAPQVVVPPIPQGKAQGGFSQMTAGQFRDSMGGQVKETMPLVSAAPSVPTAPIAPAAAAPLTIAQPERVQEKSAVHVTEKAILTDPTLLEVLPLVQEEQPLPEQIRIESQAEPTEAAAAEAVSPLQEEIPWRLAGEVMGTYLVIEQGETIYLVDKHATHERMHFDRMKSGEYTPMAQSLLEPFVYAPTPEEGAALLSQLPLLEEFGFDVSDFGGGTLVVRQTPFDIAPGEIAETLGEIAEGLLSGTRQNPSGARDHLLHTMACKAAIKGGQKNAPEELLVVAKAVMAGEVKYCPHGRPVAITLTRGQLERQFGRA